ncbi:MAG: hypothetical protein ABSB00_03060 [Minisyncoccia bacterium]|jgi:hypothetical protein
MKNIFISIFSFSKRLHYGARLEPVRDWLSLLTFSAIALVGIIVWNVWAFDTVISGGVIGSSATSTPPVFSQSSLDTIHTIFANRAAEEEKYETGTYSFTDPSQ